MYMGELTNCSSNQSDQSSCSLNILSPTGYEQNCKQNLVLLLSIIYKKLEYKLISCGIEGSPIFYKTYSLNLPHSL